MKFFSLLMVIYLVPAIIEFRKECDEEIEAEVNTKDWIRSIKMYCQTCRKMKQHHEIEVNLYQCRRCKRHIDLR